MSGRQKQLGFVGLRGYLQAVVREIRGLETASA